MLETIRNENPQLPTTQISKPMDIHRDFSSLSNYFRRNNILLSIHVSIHSTQNYFWMIWISSSKVLGEIHSLVIFFVHLQPLPFFSLSFFTQSFIATIKHVQTCLTLKKQIYKNETIIPSTLPPPRIPVPTCYCPFFPKLLKMSVRLIGLHFYSSI